MVISPAQTLVVIYSFIIGKRLWKDFRGKQAMLRLINLSFRTKIFSSFLQQALMTPFTKFLIKLQRNLG